MGGGKGKPDTLWTDIWKLAGSVGVDPLPLTLRELVWMSKGMLEERWEHTSWMMAHLANIHRDPKKSPFKPAQFNPILLSNVKPLPKEIALDLLKAAFIGGPGRKA